jgi:uracil-DNA glycosylase
MAGSFAGGHSNRTRARRLLFPDRHLHHRQHRFEFAIVDLPALMAASGKQLALDRHVARLRRCRRCPRMGSTPVSGGAIVSEVMIIGQAPGPREPTLKRPFAHTAGQTLFCWFEQYCGMNEAAVRSKIYFAAVCRCFPGKSSSGTDRVPAPDEIRNCSSWMNEEIKILKPRLIIPVGRLAISQFIDCEKLDKVIGKRFRVRRANYVFSLIPLPHPSGASPWHKIPPGKQLLEKAMHKIARHPAIKDLTQRPQRARS